MPAGRGGALLGAVLVAFGLLVLAALAVFAAVPVLIAASSLFAIAVGLLLKGRPTRPRGRLHLRRASAQRWPIAVPAQRQQAGATWTTSWTTGPPLRELATVRQRVATLLTDWEVDNEAAQPTLLVLTELLTNAVEHGRAPIRLTLGFSSAFVRVQVHDAAPQPPRGRSHDSAGGRRGHGLQLVDAVAVRRGWTPEPDGKTVWADVPTDWPEAARP